ncbi:hydroxymethylglutaryl-CoA reductase, degradative [Carnobacterium divergens]|uniref:hydroxymethylglutaryl-CoA reductase, degradative n=1 Tax=Carnobacterium divergens TaxID=2748 RepID=UPI0039AFB9A7
MDSTISKFYQKSRQERIKLLAEKGFLTENGEQLFMEEQLLDATIADNMIENQLSQFPLPIGVALNFLVDQKDVIVPMVTEEPSVIAASSNGAKMIRSGGGFTTEIHERAMIGQLIFKDVLDIEAAAKMIRDKEQEIIEIASRAHPSIVKRGGGVKRVETRIIKNEALEPEYLTVHLIVDVQEAMGANTINTILEATVEPISNWIKGSTLMQILSNYGDASLVTAKCEIPVTVLATGEYSGAEVAKRISEATYYAHLDPYRAATHNKGIMNGIDAVVMASGNDTRAIEAGAHAYASRTGRYKGMSNWFVNEAGNLAGELTLPMPVGTVGGAISVLPLVKANQELLQIHQATELASIIVSVGLAQNLAALKALVTEGIQRGHMSLQAKALAIHAGATGDEIEQVVAELRKAPQMNLATAQAILKKIN